jgi:hypothetical protein
MSALRQNTYLHNLSFILQANQPPPTTPDPLKLLQQALQSSLTGASFGFGSRPTPSPPTTTPNYMIAVNPYRQEGFFLGATNYKTLPKPATKVIEVSTKNTEFMQVFF